MSSINIFLNTTIKNIKFCYLKQKKLILIKLKKTTYYFILNNSILITKTNKKTLNVLTKDNCKKIMFLFLDYFEKIQIIKRKILVLKGLGLKAFLDNKKKMLTLKLGFSHLFNILIEKDIFVQVKKNFLFFKSYNEENLGSFSYKIKNLKNPDVYKGKGIWFRNEKLKLKQVKKK
jgi:hypothetical protein